VDEAERVGLLKVAGGRIGFWHPLVRSAVYAAATDAERTAAHRTLAEALSGKHPARSAWHLVVSGAEPDESVARSLDDAAHAARRAGACASASRLFDKAASATPETEPGARRLLLAGEAAWLAGEPQRAGALLDSSQQLTHDPDLLADIALARWWVQTSGGNPRELFEPLIAQAGRLVDDNPRKAASMLAVAWDWAWSSLDIDRSRDLVDRAETLLAGDLRSEDRELLTAIGWQRLADCRVPEALDAARRAIEESTGSPDIQVAYACEVLSAADLLGEAQASLAGAVAELTRLGHMPALSYSLRTQATIELRQGRLLQALKTAGEAQALTDDGNAAWAGWADAQVAAIEAVVGLEDGCREHVARASQSFGGDDRLGACREPGGARAPRARTR